MSQLFASDNIPNVICFEELQIETMTTYLQTPTKIVKI